jgi:argininosuccinate lyase
MTVRQRLLDVLRAACQVHDALRSRALELTQISTGDNGQAPPAALPMLGQRWLAMADVLTRDCQRVQAAYLATNRSPLSAMLGAGAGIGLDRERVAQLLGFDGVVENTDDAENATDHLTGAVSALHVMAVDTGQCCLDIQTWCSDTRGLVPAGDPVTAGEPDSATVAAPPCQVGVRGFRRCRDLLSEVVGLAQLVMTMVHNTPFDGGADLAGNLLPYVWQAADTLARALRRLAGELERIQVGADRLLVVWTEPGGIAVEEVARMARARAYVPLPRWVDEQAAALAEAHTELRRAMANLDVGPVQE